MRYSDLYRKDLLDARSGIVGAENLNGKSILITGCTGLIGSAITDYLLVQNNNGLSDIGIYLAGRNKDRVAERFEEYSEGKDYFYVEYDCCEPLSFPSDKTPDYIIHLAGIANTSQYSVNPCGVMEASISGCEYILKYAKENPGTRVVYVSSSEIYGNNGTGKPYKESEYFGIDITSPRACYPSAKIASETMCASYHSQYEVDAVIVRPGHIYGPTAVKSDKRASSQFSRDVLDDHVIIMKSSGEQRRSYCYVIDCVTAILTVMLKGISEEAYNISNPDSVVSIREMAEAFAKAGNATLRIEAVSADEKRGYTMMNDSVLDGSKLERLGWKGRFDMKIGAERTLECMRYQEAK